MRACSAPGARIAGCVLLGLLAALPGRELSAAAESASELIAAGNRAFRGGNPEAAIALYVRAQALGDTSPRVNFNLGVAHYRAGDYAPAARALRVAAQDAKLAPLAWYNLGLAYWAQGDRQSARPCFEWTERMAPSGALRGLATKALDALAAGHDAPHERPEPLLKPRAGPSLLAAVRFGADDNPLRTPDSPYVDLGSAGQPVVTPAPRSGNFVEAELYAASLSRTRHGTVLRRAYELDARTYLNDEVGAADEHSHRLSFSSDGAFGSRGHRRLRTFTFVGSHEEVNFDPDDGLERVSSSGEDLSDRFSYYNAGTRWNFEHALGRAIAGVRAEAEIRRYARVDTVSQHDGTLALAGAYIEWPIGEAVLVTTGFDRYRRDYDERPARDLSGALVAGNPLLVYDYQRLSGGVRFDLGRRGYVRLTADATERTDGFVGYNDYDRIGARMQSAWRVSPRVRIEAEVEYRDYGYPNAFAFDVPAGGARAIEHVSGEMGVEVDLWRNLSLWAAAQAREVSSSDPRYAYSRRQFPVGLQWRAGR
ncbi:MAG: tetratricopeptide repeat protein [Gammaproteobacteria bacterium]